MLYAVTDPDDCTIIHIADVEMPVAGNSCGDVFYDRSHAKPDTVALPVVHDESRSASPTDTT